MSSDKSESYIDTAFEFTQALIDRNYDNAFSYTASDFREAFGGPLSVEDLKKRFEEIIPSDWKFVDFDRLSAQWPMPATVEKPTIRGPLSIQSPMLEWPSKKPNDIASIYVTIAGEFYGEGLSVVISREGEELKVREIEFGRP